MCSWSISKFFKADFKERKASFFEKKKFELRFELWKVYFTIGYNKCTFSTSTTFHLEYLFISNRDLGPICGCCRLNGSLYLELSWFRTIFSVPCEFEVERVYSSFGYSISLPCHWLVKIKHNQLPLIQLLIKTGSCLYFSISCIIIWLRNYAKKLTSSNLFRALFDYGFLLSPEVRYWLKKWILDC